MKNYLDHDFYDKYYSYKEEEQVDYQWVIEHIEQTYDFVNEDIKNYSEYLKVKIEYMDVIRLLIDINKLMNISYVINNDFLNELNNLAMYHLNKVPLPNLEEINHKYKDFLLIFYIGIFMAKTNKNEKMLYDITWIETKNIFQISHIHFDKEQVIVINSFLSNLNMAEKQKMLCIFEDNIVKKEIKYNHSIFEKINIIDLKYTLFNFKSLDYDKNFITWQEKYIIDIVGVNINSDSIQPNFVMRDGTSYPDITKWTTDIINNLILFFNNDNSKIILEILNYYKNNVIPSEYTIRICLDYFIDSINDFNVGNIKRYQFNNIYLLICGKLFKDNLINVSLKRTCLPKIHLLLLANRNFGIVNLCYENNIPLNRNIKQIIIDYYNEKCNKISQISSYADFADFIKDSTIRKLFVTSHLIELHSKFLNIIENSDGISLASLFTIYIRFILSIQKNINIDSTKTKSIILELTVMWKERFFKMSRQSLHSFKSEIKIEDSQVKAINNQIVKETYSASKGIIDLSKKSIINKLKYFSTVPMYVMLKDNSYIIDTDFPYRLKRDFISENSIGLLINQYLDEIIEENGYRLLNQFKTDLYQHSLYDDINQHIIFFISLFKQHVELYQLIKQKNKLYEFIDLNDKVTVAHTTQLFPLLEIKIKELGIIHGIVPFKEDEEDYTKTKDPSSILRELIAKEFGKEKKLDNLSDILFVYFCLYDNNMLNVRNELIHGRRYMFLGDEYFAFKISLISLKLILDRIKRDKKK